MIQKKVLRLPILLLFILLIKSVSGQQLHHQMLSSMGSTTTSTTGLIFLQTVGQQSVTGNVSVSNLTVQQGFQQSLVSKIFPVFNLNIIETTVYPNPFRDIVNFNFSQKIAGNMSIALYNLFGVQIFKEVKQDAPLTIGFNFGYLPAGSYIINITANNYSYSKTLIKQ
jgi:hypothetical protein